MIHLKRGITGLRSITEPPIPRVEYALFCRLAYDLGRVLHGEVVSIQSDGSGCNFYQAIFGTTPKRYVLCNAVYPILAWSKESVGFGEKHRFVDEPQTSTILSMYPSFYCARAEDLHAHVSGDDMHDLSHVEHEQAEYWNAQTFGDFIFNYWD